MTSLPTIRDTIRKRARVLEQWPATSPQSWRCRARISVRVAGRRRCHWHMADNRRNVFWTVGLPAALEEIGEKANA